MRISFLPIEPVLRKVCAAIRSDAPWRVATTLVAGVSASAKPTAPPASRIKRAVLALLLAAASLAALPACSTLTGEEPPTTDSTLVEVLVELNLAKARAEADDLPEAAPDLRDSIFARYGLSEADFETKMDAYARHPDAYAALYDAMLDKLEAERYDRPASDERTASE